MLCGPKHEIRVPHHGVRQVLSSNKHRLNYSYHYCMNKLIPLDSSAAFDICIIAIRHVVTEIIEFVFHSSWKLSIRELILISLFEMGLINWINYRNSDSEYRNCNCIEALLNISYAILWLDSKYNFTSLSLSSMCNIRKADALTISYYTASISFRIMVFER